MKSMKQFRPFLSVIILAAVFSPSLALAGNGKKFFEKGMKHEAAEEWDKAAEAFALAVSESPKNPEYRLHFSRASFMASQMFYRTGAMLAKEKDYVGAYNAFRKAYAFDPVNELAKNEMERMQRLQAEQQDTKAETRVEAPAKISPQLPQMEIINVGPYPGGIETQTLIKDLAKSLDLNVVFDGESFRAGTKNPISIELSNVTAAKALDYIFLQQNLFFQKVGPRTILVASGNRRQNLQQLVLKTFYLANADPNKVQKVVQTAIPAQPGRTPTTVLVDEPTNSVTIRDTEENIRLIGDLIKSLDKDRAEVVMDVAIYEVSKSDLLKLGNQIGNDSQLTNLGGTTRGVVGANKGKEIFGNLISPGSPIPTAFGVGWAIPAANLQALQSRGNTKLIASTQVHAFNNEKSKARIGQRVPVRSASYAPVVSMGNQNNTNNFVGDVINYEQVGLTLEFKPLVFPNQDVQVEMTIESKDVVAGGTSQNPVFSERTINGTARVQNNKTLLLASVAQDVESNTKSGLPLVGLIPILGRLFTAPQNENRQVDIVIAITPRVIRVPAILPEDELARPTGSLAVPTSGSLEDFLVQEEMSEKSAKNIPAKSRDFKADQTAVAGSRENTENSTTSVNVKQAEGRTDSESKDGLSSGNQVAQMGPDERAASGPEPGALNAASLTFGDTIPMMKKGDTFRLPVFVKSVSMFQSAVLGVRYMSASVRIKSVTLGDVFGTADGTAVNPFLDEGGRTYVTLSPQNGTAQNPSGILAWIEVEALDDGKFSLEFDSENTSLLTPAGRAFRIAFR